MTDPILKVLAKRGATPAELIKETGWSRATVFNRLKYELKKKVYKLDGTYYSMEKDLPGYPAWLVAFQASSYLKKYYPKALPPEQSEILGKVCLNYLEKVQPELLARYIENYQPPVGISDSEKLPLFTSFFQDQWEDHYIYGTIDDGPDILLLNNVLEPHPDGPFYKVLRKDPGLVEQILKIVRES